MDKPDMEGWIWGTLTWIGAPGWLAVFLVLLLWLADLLDNVKTVHGWSRAVVERLPGFLADSLAGMSQRTWRALTVCLFVGGVAAIIYAGRSTTSRNPIAQSAGPNRSEPIEVRIVAAPTPVSAKPSPERMVAGTILATHYRTGELFSVDPTSGVLSLISASLKEPSAIAIRPNGKLIVLDADVGMLTEVDPRTGRHRMIGVVGGFSKPDTAGGAPKLIRVRPTGMVLTASGKLAVIVAGQYLVRADLDSTNEILLIGEFSDPVAPWGIAEGANGNLVFTDPPRGVVFERDSRTGELRTIASIKLAHAILAEPTGTFLVGGKNDDGTEAVFRVAEPSKVALVAAGPFRSIMGLAKEADGSIIVADNGEGAPGNGFIARIDAETGETTILVDAQTSGWKFTNGRGVAVVPSK